MLARGWWRMSVQAASGRTVQTLRQVRLALVAVIRAHERVARLLVALGDHDGAGAERRAAEGERARLARLDARLVALGDPGPNGP